MQNGRRISLLESQIFGVQSLNRSYQNEKRWKHNQISTGTNGKVIRRVNEYCELKVPTNFP